MRSDIDIRRAHPPGAVFTTWRAPDGWAIRRMDWRQQAGAPTRGNLLFAGGRGDFIEKYLESHAAWHAAGWNVTTFDWRGQGGSRGDIVGGNHASFDPLVDDLAALLADWRGAAPGPHVAIGHSMGGHLLLRTLAERAPALDAAVLIAPMLEVNAKPMPPGLAPWIAAAMCRLGRRDERVWKAPPPGDRRQRALTGGSPERYADEGWWWDREPGFNIGPPSWGWLAAAYRSAAQAFTPEKLATVGLPVLLLASATDRLVGLAAIERAAALLPDAILHVYPRAGHEILRDADPIRDDALARIAAFLDEHAS